MGKGSGKYLFILVRAEEGPQHPVIYCKKRADKISQVVNAWVEVGKGDGYLPDHMDNIADDLPPDIDEDSLRATAIRRTEARFGIGEPKDRDYDDEWLIIQVELVTGDVVTYPA